MSESSAFCELNVKLCNSHNRVVKMNPFVPLSTSMSSSTGPRYVRGGLQFGKRGGGGGGFDHKIDNSFGGEICIFVNLYESSCNKYVFASHFQLGIIFYLFSCRMVSYSQKKIDPPSPIVALQPPSTKSTFNFSTPLIPNSGGLWGSQYIFFLFFFFIVIVVTYLR